MIEKYSEPDKMPEKMYHPRSSKAAFCSRQPLRKGKPTSSTNPGPKYLSNWRNIALVQFIQDILYRDKNTVKIKCQGGIEHTRLKSEV